MVKRFTSLDKKAMAGFVKLLAFYGKGVRELARQTGEDVNNILVYAGERNPNGCYTGEDLPILISCMLHDFNSKNAIVSKGKVAEAVRDAFEALDAFMEKNVDAAQEISYMNFKVGLKNRINNAIMRKNLGERAADVTRLRSDIAPYVSSMARSVYGEEGTLKYTPCKGGKLSVNSAVYTIVGNFSDGTCALLGDDGIKFAYFVKEDGESAVSIATKRLIHRMYGELPENVRWVRVNSGLISSDLKDVLIKTVNKANSVYYSTIGTDGNVYTYGDDNVFSVAEFTGLGLKYYLPVYYSTDLKSEE